MHKYFLYLFILFALSSCSLFQIHKPIIEQGNIITNEQINELHTGMTESEVIAIMGTPVLENTFTPNQLDYIYTYQVGNHAPLKKKLICSFRDGRLVSMQKFT